MIASVFACDSAVSQARAAHVDRQFVSSDGDAGSACQAVTTGGEGRAVTDHALGVVLIYIRVILYPSVEYDTDMRKAGLGSIQWMHSLHCKGG